MGRSSTANREGHDTSAVLYTLQGIEYGRCVRSLGCGLPSWRQDGASWRKEIGTCGVGERRLGLAVLEKEDGPCSLGERRWPCSLGERRWGIPLLEKGDGLSELETGVRPCNPGERRWGFAVLEKGDRSLLSWRKEMRPCLFSERS
jgi:hypothetical protein